MQQTFNNPPSFNQNDGVQVMIAQNATPDLPLGSIKFLNADNSVISDNTKEFMNDLTVDDIP